MVDPALIEQYLPAARAVAKRIARWVGHLKQAPRRVGLPGVCKFVDGIPGKTMQFEDWVEELVATEVSAAVAAERERLREPTEAQLVAARDWSSIKYGKPIGNDAAIGCWRTMFNAILAPDLAAEGKGE